MRFPEFSGEWEKFRLQDVCSFYSGGTPSSTQKNFYNGEIPFIRSGEIHSETTELTLTQEGLNNSSAKLVKEGDLLLALYGATSGDIAISQINGAINQAILCIRSKHNNQFIKSTWVKHCSHILQVYLQGGQGNLSAEIVKKLKFSFPNNKEQKKIADFVSLLEDRIATQIKIIEKLESLIKGLCQKLTQQGDPNTILNNCLDCYSSTLQESSVLESGDFPVYGATGICGYTNTPEVIGDSILIIKDGASVGVTYYASGKYSAIGTLNRLAAKSGYSLRYIYYCLKVFNFAPYRTGLAIPHIYFRDYGKAQIWCPPIEEQNRIASALEKVEQKIATEKSLLEQLYSQKRFLLQAMFI